MRLIYALAIMALTNVGASAQYLWNSSLSDWSMPMAWTPAGVPTSGENVLFNVNGALPGSTVVNPVITAPSSGLSLTLAPNQNLGGWNFTGTQPLTIAGNVSPGIVTFGPATYAFNGPTLSGVDSTFTMNLNANVGSTIVLQGTSAITAFQGGLFLRGGTLRLDNSAVNIPARVQSTGNILLNGNGRFEFIGNSAGTSTNLPILSRVNNAIGGTNVIRVTPNGAQALITFANTGTFSLRAGTRNILRFEAGSGALGDPAGAQVKFVGTPFVSTSATAGSLLADTATGSTTGWAIVSDSFGVNFATYNTTNGILSIANPASGLTITNNTDTLAGFTTSNNAQLNISASTTVTASATLTVPSLRVTPTGPGATLNMATFSITTTAIMHEGANDLTINGTGILGTGTHYFHVNNPNATLSLQPLITTGTNATVFAGPGTIALTGTILQNNGTAGDNYRLTIVGGVLRANNLQMGFDTTRGVIGLHGGVLEITGGAKGTGASADFRRALGTSGGNVNWGGNTGEAVTGSDKGSGGFSAFGAAASVNIGGLATPATLQWNQTNFVNTGLALRFGSTKSNAELAWLNPINLVNGTGYQLREINVTDNPNSNADFTSLNGEISGATADADLVKTGNGTLHFEALATYVGNTLVQGGRLNVNATHNTAGKYIVGDSATMGGRGTIGNPITVLPGGTIKGGVFDAGTLTVQSVSFQPGARIGVSIIEGSTSAASSTGLSTLGTLPNPVSNTFLNKTGGTLSGLSDVNLVVDLAGTTFANPLSPYSYIIGQGFGNQSALSITSDSRFTFLNGAVVSGQTSLTGDSSGNIYLNFTPVPEPAGLLAVGLLAWAIRRKR